MHERDPARARRFLADARKGALIGRRDRALAEAAVHRADGRTAEAAELLDEAERALDGALDRGLARAQADWIEDLRSELEPTAKPSEP